MLSGFQDGVLRVFDTRCSPRDSMIALYKEYTNPIFKAVFLDQECTKIVAARYSPLLFNFVRVVVGIVTRILLIILISVVKALLLRCSIPVK